MQLVFWTAILAQLPPRVSLRRQCGLGCAHLSRRVPQAGVGELRIDVNIEPMGSCADEPPVLGAIMVSTPRTPLPTFPSHLPLKERLSGDGFVCSYDESRCAAQQPAIGPAPAIDLHCARSLAAAAACKCWSYGACRNSGTSICRATIRLEFQWCASALPRHVRASSRTRGVLQHAPRGYKIRLAFPLPAIALRMTFLSVRVLSSSPLRRDWPSSVPNPRRRLL